jgi:hypothetical protein
MSTENNICRLDEKGEPEISVWWSNGSMIYRRDSLQSSHPESTYACLERLGLDPYDYGIMKSPALPDDYPPLVSDRY